MSQETTVSIRYRCDVAGCSKTCKCIGAPDEATAWDIAQADGWRADEHGNHRCPPHAENPTWSRLIHIPLSPGEDFAAHIVNTNARFDGVEPNPDDITDMRSFLEEFNPLGDATT